MTTQLDLSRRAFRDRTRLPSRHPSPAKFDNPQFIPGVGVVVGRRLVATERFRDGKHSGSSEFQARVEGNDQDTFVTTFRGDMSVRGGHDALHIVIANILNALGAPTGHDTTLWNEAITDAFSASHHPNSIIQPGDHQYNSTRGGRRYSKMLFTDAAFVFRKRIVNALPEDERPAAEAILLGRTTLNRYGMGEAFFLEQMNRLFPDCLKQVEALYRATGAAQNLYDLLCDEYPEILRPAREAVYGRKDGHPRDVGFSDWQDNPLSLRGKRIDFATLARICLQVTSQSRRGQGPFRLESILQHRELKLSLKLGELSKIKSHEWIREFESPGDRSTEPLYYVPSEKKWDLVYRLFCIIEDITIEESSTFELTDGVDSDWLAPVAQDPDIALWIDTLRNFYDQVPGWTKWRFDPVTGERIKAPQAVNHPT